MCEALIFSLFCSLTLHFLSFGGNRAHWLCLVCNIARRNQTQQPFVIIQSLLITNKRGELLSLLCDWVSNKDKCPPLILRFAARLALYFNEEQPFEPDDQDSVLILSEYIEHLIATQQVFWRFCCTRTHTHPLFPFTFASPSSAPPPSPI